MGELAIMGDDGHTAVLWDRDIKDEVDTAQKEFEDAMGPGKLAYSTKHGVGELIREFDPDAETIVIGNALVGG